MCQTDISCVDEMDEISSSSQSYKKTDKIMQPRKIRKPLMEKKRRARINHSLDELKRIVVEAEQYAGHDLNRVNKLEKADILEMTVKYLKRSVARPRVDVYVAGYRQCVNNVRQLLEEQWTDGLRPESGRRMVQHLESCVSRLHVPPPPPPPPTGLRLSLSSSDESSNSNDGGPNIRPPPVAADESNKYCYSPLLPVSVFDDNSHNAEDGLAALYAKPSPNRPTAEYPNTTPQKTTWRPW